MRKSRLLTAHVESHFGARRHGGIGIRRMNSDASDRLPVTWSLGQNLANTVGCPSARIIYLGWVYLGPQRPHLSLAHVPAYRPENLHFQWLFWNNSYSLPFNTLLSSSSSSSGSLHLAHVPRPRRFVAVLLPDPLTLPSCFSTFLKAHCRGLFRTLLFGSLAVSRTSTIYNGGTLMN